MIDKTMIMNCLLARIQAQGRELGAVSPAELIEIVAEVIDDLQFAAGIIEAKMEHNK